MGNVLKLNFGLKRIPIKNEYDEVVGVLEFNPKDAGLVKKINDNMAHLKDLEEVGAMLQEIGAEENASGEDLFSANELLEKAAECVKQFCDGVFGEMFYNKAFSQISPLAMLDDGSLLFNVCLKQITEAIGEETKRKQSVKKKYLQEYEK